MTATLGLVKMSADSMIEFDQQRVKRIGSTVPSHYRKLESLYTPASVKEISHLVQATSGSSLTVIVNDNGNQKCSTDLLHFSQYLQERAERSDSKLNSNLKMMFSKKSVRKPTHSDVVAEDLKKALR